MKTRILIASLLLAAPTALAAEMEVQVDLHEYTGGFHILPEQINARVGDVVTLRVANQGQAPHSLIVCGDAPHPANDCQDAWGRVAPMGANETRPLQFTAQSAGTFEYWCDVPGHKGAGMLGTLVVAGDAAEEKKVPAPGVIVLAVALALALALVGRRRA